MPGDRPRPHLNQTPNQPAAPPVTARQFIADALYHPAGGYYSKHARTVGRHGDFSTSTTLSPALGQAVAHWLRQTPHPQHLIEVGAGDGSLAASILDALPWLARRRTTYHIVEASPTLTSIQRKHLGRRARWHPDIHAATTACNHRATVVSNELVDAFPPHVFRWDASSHHWLELLVDPTTGTTSLAPPADPDTTPPTEHPFADGQQVERHTSFRDWLASWAPHMHHLTLLTIDYGDTFPTLYHRRPNGTLRAYLAHQRLTGPDVFKNQGHQDITADVNFSDLQRWGEQLGLTTTSLTTQRDFLRSHLNLSSSQLLENPTLQYLLDPYGPGTAFKCLVQQSAAQIKK